METSQNYVDYYNFITDLLTVALNQALVLFYNVGAVGLSSFKTLNQSLYNFSEQLEVAMKFNGGPVCGNDLYECFVKTSDFLQSIPAIPTNETYPSSSFLTSWLSLLSPKATQEKLCYVPQLQSITAFHTMVNWISNTVGVRDIYQADNLEFKCFHFNGTVERPKTADFIFYLIILFALIFACLSFVYGSYLVKFILAEKRRRQGEHNLANLLEQQQRELREALADPEEQQENNEAALLTLEQEQQHEAAGVNSGQQQQQQQQREAAGTNLRQQQQQREATGINPGQQQQQVREAAGANPPRQQQQVREVAGTNPPRQQQQVREAAGANPPGRQQQVCETTGANPLRQQQQVREVAGANPGQQQEQRGNPSQA